MVREGLVVFVFLTDLFVLDFTLHFLDLLDHFPLLLQRPAGFIGPAGYDRVETVGEVEQKGGRYRYFPFQNVPSHRRTCNRHRKQVVGVTMGFRESPFEGTICCIILVADSPNCVLHSREGTK